MANKKVLNASEFVENGGIIASPIVHKGIVYIGVCDGHFYALDPEDGSFLWKYRTDGPILSNAVIVNDIIHFNSFDGNIYALSLDGKLKWKFFFSDSPIAATPFIHKGVCYVASSDGHLYALGLESKSILWKFKTGDEILCDPIVYKDRIYFGSMDSYFYCLNLKGQLEWRYKTGDSIVLGSPVIDEKNNTVLFGSADESLYALTLDGKFKWGFRTGDYVHNAITLHEDKIYLGSRDRYLYVLDAKTGICQWRYRGNNVALGRPLVYKNMVLFGSDGLYALDLNGNQIWHYPITPNSIIFSIIVRGEDIIATSMDTYLRCFSLDGTLIWQFKTESPSITFSQLIKVMSSPKWEPNRFEKLSEEEKKTITEFKPYTFTPEEKFEMETEKMPYSIEKEPYDTLKNVYETGSSERKAKKEEEEEKAKKEWAKRFGL